MNTARSPFQYTPLWAAVASAISELQATSEVRIETAEDYVIDYICRELAAKQVVAPSALGVAPGR
jgi:hypothetical protein